MSYREPPPLELSALFPSFRAWIDTQDPAAQDWLNSRLYHLATTPFESGTREHTYALYFDACRSLNAIAWTDAKAHFDTWCDLLHLLGADPELWSAHAALRAMDGATDPNGIGAAVARAKATGTECSAAARDEVDDLFDNAEALQRPDIGAAVVAWLAAAYPGQP